MKLQVVGNTLTAFINGVQVGAPYVATDADKMLASGGFGSAGPARRRCCSTTSSSARMPYADQA